MTDILSCISNAHITTHVSCIRPNSTEEYRVQKKAFRHYREYVKRHVLLSHANHAETSFYYVTKSVTYLFIGGFL